GYPNYKERYLLVKYNRTRADPNSPAAGTAGRTGRCEQPCASPPEDPAACFWAMPVKRPFVYSHAGSRAARFHGQNLILTSSRFSHSSSCTIRSDVADTNCDGAAECACVPGSEHFSCATEGHGSSFTDRDAIFGFANPRCENMGGTGLGSGLASPGGFETECADSSGHRWCLCSFDLLGIGMADLSGGCGGGIGTLDLAEDRLGEYTVPVLAAGVHEPMIGAATTAFAFWANYYDPGGEPQAIDVVIDGTCHPLARELGVLPGNATYRVSLAVGAGCHQYWFRAVDSMGIRRTYPEVGAWGVGDAESCLDYTATATAADCEACQINRACTADGGCASGSLACPGGVATCTDLVDWPDQTFCGEGKSCHAGACVDCQPGTPCTANSGCLVGAVDCSTGSAVCSNPVAAPNGTTCGFAPSNLCRDGACVYCQFGQPCESADYCSVGHRDCSTGFEVCTGLVPKADGANCGSGQTCSAGHCGACVAGAPCYSADGCRAGTLDCSSGFECVDLVAKPDGTRCGAGGYCRGGVCAPCHHFALCTANDGCRVGEIDCTIDGTPRCVDLANVADGTACGSGRMCRDGACTACGYVGGSCRSADGCQQGTIDCSAGVPSCVNLTDVADGTPCGTDRLCQGGTCSGCAQGAACRRADGCLVGTVSCAGGDPTCDDLAPAPSGTSCGANKACDGSGNCRCTASGSMCYRRCWLGKWWCAPDDEPVCLPGTMRADGFLCQPGGGGGALHACVAGRCGACNPGAACRSADGCQSGTSDCSGETEECANLVNLPDGTPCGTDGWYCRDGRCSGCAQGAFCTSADGCRTGSIDCATGRPVCFGLLDRPDGEPCATGLCSGGICRLRPDGGDGDSAGDSDGSSGDIAPSVDAARHDAAAADRTSTADAALDRDAAPATDATASADAAFDGAAPDAATALDAAATDRDAAAIAGDALSGAPGAATDQVAIGAAADGCNCRATGSPTAVPSWCWLLLAIAVGATRRRRAASVPCSLDSPCSR
ncbi:MAG: hypothetical protein JXR83_07250, partial [Deltaproteobacteria bacterium]|nr:hypothetical protein [Deltaproteobacteria bacterium]